MKCGLYIGIGTSRTKSVLLGESGITTDIADSPQNTMMAHFRHLFLCLLLIGLTACPAKEPISPDQIHGIYAVAFSPDGEILAASGESDKITLWDTHSWKILRTLAGHTDAILALAWSPHQDLLASGGRDDTIILWNPSTGARERTLYAHTNAIDDVAFSPDGQTLAASSWDATLTLWDVAGMDVPNETEGNSTEEISDKPRQRLLGHEESVEAVAFSADSQRLVSGANQMIYAWDVATGQRRHVLGSPDAPAYAVAFNADGQMLASRDGELTSSNAIKVWDVAAGAIRQSFTVHQKVICSAAFSPDGNILASGGLDKTVKLWNLATGALHQTLTGHTSSVGAVTFSPDNRLVASGSQDGTIRIWDTTTGQTMHVLTPSAAIE